MNVLLRVTSCRVLEMMKKDPAYAEQIGLADASEFTGSGKEPADRNQRKPE